MPSDPCIRCGVVFANTSTLKRHMTRLKPCVPVDPAVTTFKCECGKYFMRKDSLVRHRREACGNKRGQPDPEGLAKAKAIAEERNGVCLSDAYVNGSEHLQWKCLADGYVWGASLDNVKRGRWCPQCAGRPKLDIDTAREIAAARNGLCLSDEYNGSGSLLRWKCNRDGAEWSSSLNNVRNRRSWCPQCNCRRNENETRKLFEFFTGEQFPETAGLFPRNNLWRLDGYCEKLGVAFEFHGEQHFGYHPFFHRGDPSNF